MREFLSFATAEWLLRQDFDMSTENVYLLISSFLEAMAVCGVMATLNRAMKPGFVKMICFATIMAIASLAVEYLKVPYHLLLTSAIMVTLYFLLSGNPFLIVLTDSLISIGLIALIQVLITTALSMSGFNITNNPWLIWVILSVIAGVFFYLSKIDKVDYFWETKYRRHRNTVILLAISILFPATIIVNIFTNEPTLFFQQDSQLLVMFAAYFVTNILLVFSLIRMRRERQTGKMMIGYGKVLERNLNDLKHLAHEHKGHLQMVCSIAETCPPERIKNEINAYVERVLRHEAVKNISTMHNNTVLSAYLYGAAEIAEKLQIKFEQYVESANLSYPIDEYDLIEVLMNLVNNAFEEVVKMPQEKRNVYIEFTETKIIIANTMRTSVTGSRMEKFRRDGYSTKGTDRGFGLTNVSNVREIL
jgi:two-component system sensor histidine kinase AgrC